MWCFFPWFNKWSETSIKTEILGAWCLVNKKRRKSHFMGLSAMQKIPKNILQVN